MFALTIAAVALSLPAVLAAPALERSSRAAAPVALSAAQIAAFTPYSYLAAAGYCDVAETLAWSCGTNCRATPQFIPTASGGAAANEQSWFVGFYPPTNEVVVSYQGTDKQDITSVFLNVNFFLQALNTTFFPAGAAEIHRGFGDAFELSATPVLAAVRTTLAAHPGASVVATGHSLGGAVSQITAVYLRQQLPTSTKIRWIGYSTPRVGNSAWADLVDSSVRDVTRINNDHDMVPTLPGRFAGFAHPSGEIHINGNGKWLSCPGRDSTASGCTIDTVPSIFSGSLSDHRGPFNGVKLSSSMCDA